MLDCDWYKKIDKSHGMALTALSSHLSPEQRGGNPDGSDVPIDFAGGCADEASYDNMDFVDPDPTDEVMTGDGDPLTLLFALFVDGVQLHDHGRATTTVIGLKCLDLDWGIRCC